MLGLTTNLGRLGCRAPLAQALGEVPERERIAVLDQLVRRAEELPICSISEPCVGLRFARLRGAWRRALAENRSPKDERAERRRRSPKVTAAALGTAAALIAATAGPISALSPWFGNDGGSGVVAPGGTGATAEAPKPDALDHVVLADSLEGGGPFDEAESEVCAETSTALGYRIEVRRQFTFCDQLVKPTSALTTLRSARIEVTALWTKVPRPLDARYGAGDASVNCRANGLDDNATAYFAGVTTNGHWEFNRYVHGKQSRLMSGNDEGLASSQGESRRLRLDCLEVEDRDIRLDFYVDRALVGTYTDSDPLPGGLVGVSAGNYTKQPLAVTFRELRVYGESP
jgi:hypothetical protein